VTERDRYRRRNRAALCQFTSRGRLGRQPASCLVRIEGTQRETGGEFVADAVDRVNGAIGGDRTDRQVPPLRKLIGDQPVSDRGSYPHLVAVHHVGKYREDDGTARPISIAPDGRPISRRDDPESPSPRAG
jgi:hypothetical protein